MYLYNGSCDGIEAMTSSHAGDLSQAAAPLRQQGYRKGHLNSDVPTLHEGTIELFLSRTYLCICAQQKPDKILVMSNGKHYHLECH